MFETAQKTRKERESYAENWTEFMNGLNKSNLILTPWCKIKECELEVKERSGNESKEGEDAENSSLTG